MEKVFLLDIINKACISTDNRPYDLQQYSVCAEIIDIVIDISGIYKSFNKSKAFTTI